MRKAMVAVILSATAIAAALGIANSAAAGSSTEHFSLIDVSTNESQVVFSAIATGRFTAGGSAVVTGKGVVTMRFQEGTVTLRIKNRHRMITSYPGCLQTQASSGTYTIADGTGAYKGISGSGKSASNVTLVDTMANGRCSGSPAAIQAVAMASGPVSLP
jgi:hypothetical protein